MKVFQLGEVTDPKDLLLSRRDKLIGCLIRGTFYDNYLLCIATNNVTPYDGDLDFRGQSGLLIYNPGSTEIYTSIGKSDKDLQGSLAYLRDTVGLNKFELNELFGHDGPSSNLVEHISKLVATLPPAADECRTERDAGKVTISTARTVIKNIIARHGDGMSMSIRFFDGHNWAGRMKTAKALHHFENTDPAESWVLDTGDGHVNPVIRIAPLRNRRTGQYVIGVWFDSMIEYSNEWA
jgi:hypothetical protein